MADWSSSSVNSVTCQQDIVAQAEEVRRWWYDEGYREFNEDAGNIDIWDCPITIQCSLSGVVMSVKFDPETKSHMTDSSIRDELRRACRQVKFSLQPSVDDLSYHAWLELMSDQIDEVEHFFKSISSMTTETSTIRGKSRDGAVSVTYRGICLSDIRVTSTNWALLSTEGKIESSIIEASRIALGLDRPQGGLSWM